MSEKTIFEKIIDREIPASFLYEDDHVAAFLDAYPFEKGHVLVIPKKPYVSIWEMSQNEYEHLQGVVHAMAVRIKETLGIPVAIYQRNERGAGQEVPHVHVHLVPRFTLEQERPIFNDIGEGRLTGYDSPEEEQSFVEKLTLM